MKRRLLTGWHLGRVFYVLIGLAFIIHSIILREWLEGVLGGYFAVMGIFSLGCASGNCYGGRCGTNR